MTTCALVGASPEFNAEHFGAACDAGAFDEVIAVDGGLAYVESLDVEPDLVLGDFDSLGYVPRGEQVLRFPVRKDASDMELALDAAARRHHHDLRVYGALGGRSDHTLANLQVLAHMSEQGFSVEAIGASEEVAFVTGPGRLDLPVRDEGIVSVFSMSDEACGVTERGLAYEVEDMTLTNRTSRGLSNEFTGTPAAIGVESGTLAIFLPL